VLLPVLLLCHAAPSLHRPYALSPSAGPHLRTLPAGTGEVMPAGSGGWRPAYDRYRIPGYTSSEAPANESSWVAR